MEKILALLGCCCFFLKLIEFFYIFLGFQIRKLCKNNHKITQNRKWVVRCVCVFFYSKYFFSWIYFFFVLFQLYVKNKKNILRQHGYYLIVILHETQQLAIMNIFKLDGNVYRKINCKHFPTTDAFNVSFYFLIGEEFIF